MTKMPVKMLACSTAAIALIPFANAQTSKPATAEATARKPNILYIVADDLGWKDVGFNGAREIKTPNIDALAAGGAKFAQFYVQPMCTPARCAHDGALSLSLWPANDSHSHGRFLRTGHYGMAHAAVPERGRL